MNEVCEGSFLLRVRQAGQLWFEPHSSGAHIPGTHFLPSVKLFSLIFLMLKEHSPLMAFLRLLQLQDYLWLPHGQTVHYWPLFSVFFLVFLEIRNRLHLLSRVQFISTSLATFMLLSFLDLVWYLCVGVHVCMWVCAHGGSWSGVKEGYELHCVSAWNWTWVLWENTSVLHGWSISLPPLFCFLFPFTTS